MSKQAAFRAAQAAYAVRVCGMGLPAPVYDGPFDVMAVVRAAPVPSTPALEMHRACWTEMARMFEQAWRAQA
jgi:hypothetical protein